MLMLILILILLLLLMFILILLLTLILILMFILVLIHVCMLPTWTSCTLGISSLCWDPGGTSEGSQIGMLVGWEALELPGKPEGTADEQLMVG